MWNIAFEDPLIQQIGLALKAEVKSNAIGGQLYAETMANALAVQGSKGYYRRKYDV